MTRGQAMTFLLAVVAGLVYVPSRTMADATCESAGATTSDSVMVSVSCGEPGESEIPGGQSSDTGAPAYLRYVWHSPCIAFSASAPAEVYVDCGVARSCVDPTYRLWQLWGLQADNRQWAYVTSECFRAPPTAADTPRPQITPGLVLTEIKRIGLPRLTVQIQPAGKTLVNFDTNFYVTPEPFTRTITLLGRSVDVEATATEYTWLHGDGTSATTTEPGAPYPALTVTYAYPHAGAVAPSVQVTYAARFRVEGGAWQQIPDTVTVDGPPGSLQVSEGTGVLSGDYQ